MIKEKTKLAVIVCRDNTFSSRKSERMDKQPKSLFYCYCFCKAITKFNSHLLNHSYPHLNLAPTCSLQLSMTDESDQNCMVLSKLTGK